MVVKRDKRARLAVKGKYTVPFVGPGVALQKTNGILFPFTPNISTAHSVDYSVYDVVHNNFQQTAYGRTRNPSIQITGNFVSQTIEEAAYTVGVMHFLRVVTKMHFGREDPAAGTPPPVLSFSAYGDYNFRNVPVVVAGFNFIYEDGVDYIEVEVAGQFVQIPVLMTISMDLMPHYSPKLQNKFTLENFASGAGYKQGFI